MPGERGGILSSRDLNRDVVSNTNRRVASSSATLLGRTVHANRDCRVVINGLNKNCRRFQRRTSHRAGVKSCSPIE